jgi:hypothetical protein
MTEALWIHGILSTAAPADLSSLDVHALTLGETIRVALRLVPRLRSGDARFDDVFWLRGHPAAAATRLLGSRLFRDAFRALEPRSPVLRASGGRLELRWSSLFSHYVDAVVPQRAIDALVAVETG